MNRIGDGVRLNILTIRDGEMKNGMPKITTANATSLANSVLVGLGRDYSTATTSICTFPNTFSSGRNVVTGAAASSAKLDSASLM